MTMTPKALLLSVPLLTCVSSEKESIIRSTPTSRKEIKSSNLFEFFPRQLKGIDDDDNRIVTYPTIPHRVVQDRRRRELRNDEAFVFGDRPHRSRRMFMEDEDEDGEEGLPPPDRSEHQQVGALFQGYGTHYVDLWVGTNPDNSSTSLSPQRQTVIVDTGSGVTAFPCSGCTDCGESYHTDSYFIEASSATFEKLDCDHCHRGRCGTYKGDKICHIAMSYQEGSSWSAYEGKDVAYCGGPHEKALVGEVSQEARESQGLDPSDASEFAFELTFGCQTSLTGLFKTQLADGIMGMDNAGGAFWKQMHASGVIDKKIFSLCFNRQSTASRDGTWAGALTMGGVDRRLHRSTMVYAKNIRTTGFFTVKLKAVYLRENGGEYARPDDPNFQIPHKLDIDTNKLNAGGVIVDSGTTDTYMSRHLAAPFKAAWEKITGGQAYGHDALELTHEQLMRMPTILFVLQGTDHNKDIDDSDMSATLAKNSGLADDVSPTDVVVAVPASHYMEYDEAKDQYVARLYLEEGSGSVLGANTMMGHDVAFDVESGRVGWAESACDYFNLVTLGDGSVDVPLNDTYNQQQENEQATEEEEEKDENVDSNEGNVDANEGSNGSNEESLDPNEEEKHVDIDTTNQVNEEIASQIKEDESSTETTSDSPNKIKNNRIALLGVVASVAFLAIMVQRYRNRVHYDTALMVEEDLVMSAGSDIEVSGKRYDDEEEGAFANPVRTIT